MWYVLAEHVVETYFTIMGTKWFTWFGKNIAYEETIYLPNNDYVVSLRLQRTNGKTGKIVTVY